MNKPAINERLDHDEDIAIKQLEAIIQVRLNGRVRELLLVESSAGIVLQGRSTTFYAKQLAQHEFMKATARQLLANEILVLEQSISPQHFIQ
jgi:hypothetical protein